MPSMDTNGSPEKPQARGRRKGTLKRSLARLAAVQGLYQLELSGGNAGGVVEEFLRHRLNDEVDGLDLSEADRDLLTVLIKGTTAERDRLDDMLAAVLSDDWPIDRLQTLLKVLLRTAVYELSERLDTPVKVVISEYMDLAHSFFSEKEPALVNGVLDRIAHSLRPEELEEDGEVSS
ncbi:transcription antitermination factor NusB [Pelagibius sp. Alg239-R121]|uniref:transcription antitermination factor NusB n=1 Tax=Pelagibius sp. Alg239-R121 TaxID=2993448 RepID=UPI0024A69B88|nr:transcription antitermination factor NusB [Pelagibius sp. Alg239-R121]